MQKMIVTAVLVGFCGCKVAQQKTAPLAARSEEPPSPAMGVAAETEEPVTAEESTLIAAHVEGASPIGEFGAIYFEFDSVELSESACARLDVIAEYLVQHPTMGVRIEGHTDDRGTADYNLALGERRAGAIKTYLGTLGVGDHQLRAVSFGEERPAYFGDEEESWSMNRRGELVEDSVEVLGAVTK